MNVFYLHSSPVQCAEWHVDKHIVKMILEYAQLLSTAHHVLDGAKASTKQLYKATHINHPSAVWARSSSANYKWLAALLQAVIAEYSYRYDKVHKTEWSGIAAELQQLPNNIHFGVFTEPPCAMPDDCKIDGTMESYQRYYKQNKAHLANWKRRGQPIWFVTA